MLPSSINPGRKRLTGDIASQVRTGIRRENLAELARNGNLVSPVIQEAREGTRGERWIIQKPDLGNFKPGPDGQ